MALTAVGSGTSTAAAMAAFTPEAFMALVTKVNGLRESMLFISICVVLLMTGFFRNNLNTVEASIQRASATINMLMGNISTLKTNIATLEQRVAALERRA